MINKANLRKRLLFVAVAVPIAFVIVNSEFSLSAFILKFFGTTPEAADVHDIYAGQILALALVLMGAHEYMKMLSFVNRVNAFWLGYVWIFVMSAAYLIGYSIPATVSNSALLILVAFEAFFCGKDAPQGRWKRASLFFIGVMFLNLASIGTMGLYREPFQRLFHAPDIPMAGRLDVVIVVTAVFMCDSAAYFVGSAWGKRKLSAISPNKTVEGSLAGLAASVIIMSACWIFIRNPEYPIIMGVAIGALIGVTAQVGDLLVSLIKRYFGVKDASHIIPGHGGILDRFDSLFFSAPVLYLFAWLLTR